MLFLKNNTQNIYKLDLENYLQKEDILPSINLEYFCQSLKPTEAKIQALDSRDIFDNGEQTFRSLLTYNLSGTFLFTGIYLVIF